MTPSSSIMTPSSSPQRKVSTPSPTVQQCLKKVDLQHIWPNLEAAGFSTVEGLSELHQDYFPALGVHDANDRRRLFLLVQTIRGRLTSSSQDVATQKEQEAGTPEQGSSARHETNSTGSSSSDGYVSRIPRPTRAGSRRETNNTTTVEIPRDDMKDEQNRQDSQDEAINDDMQDEEPSQLPRREGGGDDDETQPQKESAVVAPKTSAVATTDFKASTVTNSRSSGISIPKMTRSTVPTRASVKTQALNSRQLPTTDPSNKGTSQENVPPKEPPKKVLESISMVDKNASFKTRIEALWKTNAENHAQEQDLMGSSPQLLPDPGLMRIRVVVRKRPMSTTEVALAGNVDILQVLDRNSFGQVLVYQPKTNVDLSRTVDTIPFAFDNAFDAETNNAEIYEKAIRPLIPGLFDGEWATLFAYGQSGSGKTFTMFGSVHNSTRSSGVNYGLYFLAAMDIFQQLKKRPDLEVGVSLFEIYSGKLFDLFNEREPVRCLEDSQGQIHFPGLSERACLSAHDLMHWIHESAKFRSTGTTSRNADSSRSHAVLQLHLRNESDKSEHSRMSIIDLAGSERGADTSTACRTTRKEGAEINTSLLWLKEVIRALAKGDSVSHIPFRGSKLTQVLKDSFVGDNCRCVMISCVSPNIGNCEQTLNTLRYSNRVKERNPETGETSAEASMHPGESPSSPSQSDADETESKVLDRLLASNASFPNYTYEQPASTQKAVNLDVLSANQLSLANEVVEEHKLAMAKLLEITNAEMDLSLYQASTEGYLKDVASLHAKQDGLCQKLRSRIKAYRLSRSGVGSVSEFGAVVEDDDSIEDLRS